MYRHEQERDLNKKLLGPMEVPYRFREIEIPGLGAGGSLQHFTGEAPDAEHGWKVRCASSSASSEGLDYPRGQSQGREFRCLL